MSIFELFAFVLICAFGMYINNRIAILVVPFFIVATLFCSYSSLQQGDFVNNIGLFSSPSSNHFGELIFLESVFLTSNLFNEKSFIAHVLIFYLPIITLITWKLKPYRLLLTGYKRFALCLIVLLSALSFLGAYRFFMAFFLAFFLFLNINSLNKKSPYFLPLCIALIALPPLIHFGSFIAILPFIISISFNNYNGEEYSSLSKTSFFSQVFSKTFRLPTRFKPKFLFGIVALMLFVFVLYPSFSVRFNSYLDFSIGMLFSSIYLNATIIFSVLLILAGLVFLMMSTKIYSKRSNIYFICMILYVILLFIFSSGFQSTVALGRLSNTFLLFLIVEDLVSSKNPSIFSSSYNKVFAKVRSFTDQPILSFPL